MTKKILLATINYDHPQTGMLHAFRGIFGAENVVDFDFMSMRRSAETTWMINHRFVETVCASKPDWMWLQVQDSKIVAPEAIAELRLALPGMIVSHWTGDLRPTVSPYLSAVSRACHLTLASSKGQLPAFHQAGAPLARYCQIAVDWAEDLMVESDWIPPFPVSEVVLCGNHYSGRFPGTSDREALIKALMGAGLDVGVVGMSWPPWVKIIGACHVKKQHHVYRRAKVVLSVNHFNDVSGYYSDRQLIAMASGRPVVCKRVPGLEEEFKDGVDCLMYDEPEEAVALVKSLLSDPAQRELVGRAGRSEILRHHTWFSRILDLLPVIDELRSQT